MSSPTDYGRDPVLDAASQSADANVVASPYRSRRSYDYRRADTIITGDAAVRWSQAHPIATCSSMCSRQLMFWRLSGYLTDGAATRGFACALVPDDTAASRLSDSCLESSMRAPTQS